jgi:hypothetical protein
MSEKLTIDGRLGAMATEQEQMDALLAFQHATAFAPLGRLVSIALVEWVGARLADGRTLDIFACWMADRGDWQGVTERLQNKVRVLEEVVDAKHETIIRHSQTMDELEETINKLTDACNSQQEQVNHYMFEADAAEQTASRLREEVTNLHEALSAANEQFDDQRRLRWMAEDKIDVLKNDNDRLKVKLFDLLRERGEIVL